LHFVPRVRVTLALRGLNTSTQNLFRALVFTDRHQHLAILEVSRNIVGMCFQQFVEMRAGRHVVFGPGTFDRQSVAGKGVAGVRGNEFLKQRASRFRRLGHSSKARIISNLRWRRNRESQGWAKLRNNKVKKSRAQRRPTPESSRPISASRSEMVEVVLPNDANPLGNILGGRVMHLIDIAAAIAAHRHCNSYVVTASVDYLDFRSPIRVGDLIVLKSSVNRVFHSSMEVGVKVFSENILTGDRKHTSSAYVTFVAIDDHGRPKQVRPLTLETADDRRRYREAGLRRRIRLAHRHKRPLLGNKQ